MLNQTAQGPMTPPGTEKPSSGSQLSVFLYACPKQHMQSLAFFFFLQCMRTSHHKTLTLYLSEPIAVHFFLHWYNMEDEKEQVSQIIRGCCYLMTQNLWFHGEFFFFFLETFKYKEFGVKFTCGQKGFFFLLLLLLSFFGQEIILRPYLQSRVEN